MQRRCSGVLAAALIAATTSLAAQGRSSSPVGVPPADANSRPGTRTTTPAPSAQGRTPNTTVVSGCLESAPAAAAPATARSTPGFVLANPKMTAEGDPPAGGAVGTTGAPAISVYRLEGDEKLIAQHLNHQVRIKGSVQRETAKAAVITPTLKVDEIETIADTCAPAAR